MTTVTQTETMKYADILAYNKTYEDSDDTIITIGDEFGDGMNTLYTETNRIINPENDQKLIYGAYVPADMKEQYEDEVELVRTTNSYDWTSEFQDFLDTIADMDTDEYTKEEAIAEWNETEL